MWRTSLRMWDVILMGIQSVTWKKVLMQEVQDGVLSWIGNNRLSSSEDVRVVLTLTEIKKKGAAEDTEED